MTYNLRFTTSYSQFYLYDKDSTGATDSIDFWNDASFADKLAVETGILGVSIGTYRYVNATFSVMKHRAAIPILIAYDHVVEGSIEIKSGILQIQDCPNGAVELELAVIPGFYRVRVYTSGLNSITDEDVQAEDFYLIEMWPEEPSERQVLKRASFNW